MSVYEEQCYSWQSGLPVFDLNTSLDKTCPTRSYCRRLMDSLGHSTEATGPFLHVNMISLFVYASKKEKKQQQQQLDKKKKKIKYHTSWGVCIFVFFLLVNTTVPLTASKPERTGVAIHGEVHQSHWTLCTDGQSNNERTSRNSLESSFPRNVSTKSSHLQNNNFIRQKITSWCRGQFHSAWCGTAC